MSMTMRVGCNIYLVLAIVVPVVWLRPGLASQGSTWQLSLQVQLVSHLSLEVKSLKIENISFKITFSGLESSLKIKN